MKGSRRFAFSDHSELPPAKDVLAVTARKHSAAMGVGQPFHVNADARRLLARQVERQRANHSNEHTTTLVGGNGSM